MCNGIVQRKTHSADNRMPDAGTERNAKDAVRPGWKQPVREAARHEAASLLYLADRLVLKLRTSCEPAVPQACGAGRSSRMHFDSVRNEARVARSVPFVPTDEAINLNRQVDAYRKERSAPTVWRVSSDRGDQPQPLNMCPAEKGLTLQPSGGSRGEGLDTPTPEQGRGRRACSLRRFGHCRLRRASSLRVGGIPLGRPYVWPGL